MSSAVLTVYALLLCALLVFISGVYLVTNAGWALIAGGALLFALAGFIRNGLK